MTQLSIPVTRARLLPAAAAALALVSADALAAQRTERFTLRDERAAVYNLAGQVRVEPGTGQAVVVEVERRGGDAARLRVEQGSRGGVETLAVVYPGDRVIYPAMGRGSRTQVTVRPDGTFGGGVGEGRRRVTVAGSGRGVEAYADLRVRVPAGRSVAVHQGVGRVEVANVNGQLQVRTASAAVTATGTRGSLDVDVGSGRVDVRDAEGDLTVDSGSGGVRLEKVRGGRLMVDTGSGGVEGTDLRVRELRVDVGSGGVELLRVSAQDVLVDSGSGSVEVELERDAGSVRIDTGSGGVTLAVPEGFGATLEVDTGSGGIDVDVPVSMRRASRSHLTGRIGDGQGTVVIDTGSGGVRIRRS